MSCATNCFAMLADGFGDSEGPVGVWMLEEVEVTWACLLVLLLLVVPLLTSELKYRKVSSSNCRALERVI